MTPDRTRYHVDVEHFATPPGKAAVFFLKIRRHGDPAHCQRLMPMSLDDLGDLVGAVDRAVAAYTVAGIEAIMASPRVAGHA